ncbi:hypothetical protein JLK41_08015 [Ectopseudomonas khazarica]|uniref:hypothetical protein n=1 Tax=Ectopseudomonas khazarica TaxID=2502979 RepID=UPI001AEF582D|nr:hypothetical protein [Pseudomonas khazarica]QTS88095.1 hypothetical protein JLK41_08015 [Pseudomonas khazarica]
MSKSIDLFIRSAVPEQQIITLLNQGIPDGVESLDYPREHAAIFLQYADHEAEFQQSLGLSWASDELSLDDVQLAIQLASALSTEVLLEPEHLALPDGYTWCLATMDKQLYAVDTIDVEDGIAVKPYARKILLTV